MLELIEETVSAVARLGNLAWPIPLFRTLGLAGVHQQFEKLSIDMAQRRVEVCSPAYKSQIKPDPILTKHVSGGRWHTRGYYEVLLAGPSLRKTQVCL